MREVKEVGKSDNLRILERTERNGCKFERLEIYGSNFNLAKKKG